MSEHDRYLAQAVELARQNVQDGGRPYAAVLVRDGHVLAEAVNTLLKTNDPTDHAELRAISEATRAQGSPRLDGAIMYASGQPCPMCLALMHMTGVGQVFYAHSNEDGEPFGLSTAAIYEQMRLPLAEQSIDIQYRPIKTDAPLYSVWKKRTC